MAAQTAVSDGDARGARPRDRAGGRVSDGDALFAVLPGLKIATENCGETRVHSPRRMNTRNAPSNNVCERGMAQHPVVGDLRRAWFVPNHEGQSNDKSVRSAGRRWAVLKNPAETRVARRGSTCTGTARRASAMGLVDRHSTPAIESRMP